MYIGVGEKVCTGCLAQARRVCRWGGLVFKADRLCSSLNSRRESKKKQRRYNPVPRRARIEDTKIQSGSEVGSYGEHRMSCAGSSRFEGGGLPLTATSSRGVLCPTVSYQRGGSYSTVWGERVLFHRVEWGRCSAVGLCHTGASRSLATGGGAAAHCHFLPGCPLPHGGVRGFYWFQFGGVAGMDLGVQDAG